MPNWPEVMLRAPVRVVAWTLLLLVALSAPGAILRADAARSEPAGGRMRRRRKHKEPQMSREREREHEHLAQVDQP
jgi:hypothetical protein